MEEGIMGSEAPIFVKIADYKDVLDVIELVKNKLEQSKRILEDIEDLKRQEDAELNSWKSTLSELEERIEDVDKVLLQPESMG